MRIALAQMQPSPLVEENRETAMALMAQAKGSGADMIAFPELAMSVFFPQEKGNTNAKSVAETIPGPTTQMLADKAKSLGLVVVCNFYEVDEHGRYFDSSPVIDSDGTLLGVTRMVHITDFPGFHETEYYHPGDHGAPVYETSVGRIGVAICYDRHYPEYMRALGVAGAELVIIPQAGAVGEWPEGLYEAEVRTAAFQNGYFTALCNRVGAESSLTFAGESFVVDPEGTIIARAPQGEPHLLLVDCDLGACATSTAKRLFWRDRRPELYDDWLRS